jgi:hypothetical protein
VAAHEVSGEGPVGRGAVSTARQEAAPRRGGFGAALRAGARHRELARPRAAARRVEEDVAAGHGLAQAGGVLGYSAGLEAEARRRVPERERAARAWDMYHFSTGIYKERGKKKRRKKKKERKKERKKKRERRKKKKRDWRA